jgi:hypothetical protein
MYIIYYRIWTPQNENNAERKEIIYTQETDFSANDDMQ